MADLSHTSTRDTLPMRAARYFGVHDKPRTSIRLGNTACLMVAEFGGRTTLMHYSEDVRARGTHIKLTERQREALIEAIDWPGARDAPRGG